MRYAVHNSAGVLHSFLEEPTGVTPTPPAGWTATAVEETIRMRPGLWFNAATGSVEEAQPVTLTASGSQIINDGVETITISGLPDPCWLRINNDLVEAIGGTYAFTSTIPGQYEIAVTGPHLSAPVVVIVAPLADLVQHKWEAAKEIRNAKIAGGIPVAGIGTFDSDLESRTNILGAYSGATSALAVGQPFSIPWKMADNSRVVLDGQTMIAAGQACLAWVAACHTRSQLIGEALLAVTTRAELEAIDIQAGWPS